MKLQRECETCGEKFEFYPSDLDHSSCRFCSLECYWESRRIRFNCEICGKEVVHTKSKSENRANRFCSKECQGKAFIGDRSPSYKGGWLHENGYLRTSNGRKSKPYVHRMIVEEIIGEPLGKRIIHHIDEDRTNNDISNLMIFEDLPSHMAYHRGYGPPGVCVEDI